MSINKMTRSEFIKGSIGLTILPSHRFGSSALHQFTKLLPDEFSLTDQMLADYEIGLDILKPTKAQLEHGLELHRNSLIFDTYGFMPTAAIDGAAVADAINANASAVEIQDMREDMTQTRYVDNQEEREEFENAWEASGVTCVFQNAAYSDNAILSERTTKPAPVGRTRFAALWPDEPFDTTPRMRQSMAWTNWPLFTVGLVQMGYSDGDIQKIIGGNAMRVARAALK